MQIRWKSKAAWTVLIAQTIVIAPLIFSQGQVDILKIVLFSLMEIATAFGVFNNPTEKSRF